MKEKIMRENRNVYGHPDALYRRTETRRAKIFRIFRTRIKAIILFLLLATLAAFAFLLILRGPWWFDGEFIDKDELRSGSAALVTGLRTALIQIIAAIGASVALVYTARNYQLSRRGQVTDRFTKALERLGSDELYVRIGGVIALEQIVQDSPEQAVHLNQVLGAFVRRRAPKARPASLSRARAIQSARRTPRFPKSEVSFRLPSTPGEDVQAALSVLTRPDIRRRLGMEGALDLSGLHLDGVDLHGADLGGFNLMNCSLVGANLQRCRLVETRFDGADLSEVDISWANCMYASFEKSIMRKAVASRTDFTRAFMEGADLSESYTYASIFDKSRIEGGRFESARLDENYLSDANLRGAVFKKAEIIDCNLDFALLEGSDFSEAITLDAECVKRAVLSEDTKLPEWMHSNDEVTERLRNSPSPRWDV
ncbi:pentapeptide repeat-containing protein [Streptomyces sp. NPDC002766]|uniref:pentapeptide repeat-containing protein n=1 Tax=Streptomyces sp. NPDC002766 TaxID=3154429 RepID=UPI003319C169